MGAGLAVLMVRGEPRDVALIRWRRRRRDKIRRLHTSTLLNGPYLRHLFNGCRGPHDRAITRATDDWIAMHWGFEDNSYSTALIINRDALRKRRQQLFNSANNKPSRALPVAKIIQHEERERQINLTKYSITIIHHSIRISSSKEHHT